MATDENSMKEAENLKEDIKKLEKISEMLKVAKDDPNDSEVKECEKRLGDKRKELDAKLHDIDSIFKTDSAENPADMGKLEEKLSKVSIEKTGSSDKKPETAFKAEKEYASKKNRSRALYGLAAAALIAGSTVFGVKEFRKYDSNKSLEYKTMVTERDVYKNMLYSIISTESPELREKKKESEAKKDPRILSSALNGYVDLLMKASKKNEEADKIWKQGNYEKAVKTYAEAAKIHPRKDKTLLLEKRAEMITNYRNSWNQLYTVKPGETIAAISKRAKVDKDIILEVNSAKYPNIKTEGAIEGNVLLLNRDIESK